MNGLKSTVLTDKGYDDWQVDMTGRLICPHGNPCEDDQREGIAHCGCVSPLVQEGMI